MSEVFFAASPVLPSVELRLAKDSSACYETHSHDEFSFGVIDQGHSSYQNLQVSHRVNAGDTVLINPGDAHACNPSKGAWSYRMLFVDAAWVIQCQQEFTDKAVSDYVPFATQHLSDRAFYQRFSTLFGLLQHQATTLAAETALVEYLAALFPKAMLLHPAQNHVGLWRVRDWIESAPEAAFSLTELAQESGLSRYHFVRSFKAQFGQSPHAFQLDTRIRRAKTLLRQGNQLADVALQLGFADQSHFQRHFKRRLAVTPRVYQSFFI